MRTERTVQALASWEPIVPERAARTTRTASPCAGRCRPTPVPPKIATHRRSVLRRGLRSAGERRNGNFIEQLDESTAGTFILSPNITWADGERARALADQLSLRHLVEFGERLQRDAIIFLDRAAFEGDEIPSATVEATVRFADHAARSAFLDQYLALTAELIERHAANDGEAFLVGLAVHPTDRENT